MRPAHLTRLLLVAWAGVALWTDSVHAENKGRPDKKRVAVAAKLAREPWTKRVEGRDDDPDVAEAIALRHAQDSLAEYLRTQTPRIHRRPSADEIRGHLLAKPPEHRELSESEDSEGKGRHVVTLNLLVTEENYRDMLARDRQQRELERQGLVQERTFMVGKVLAGLVALLAALAGYFRLEEATKGYYTTWLRAGAIGFVLAVGAALFRLG
jgi:hypothetical protein